MKNRFSNILKSEKGTSIIFVLCTLLFIMIIGVSVLSAVSATNGNIVDSQADAKLELYTDSVIKTFSKSLKGNLGEQLVIKIAEKGLEKDESKIIGFSESKVDLKNKELKIEGLPETESYKVVSDISINVEDVSFIEEIPAVPEIKDELGTITIPRDERQPSILKMSLKAEVNFKVTYSNNVNSIKASYICENILINDDVDSFDKVDSSDDLGTWRLVKLEKNQKT